MASRHWRRKAFGERNEPDVEGNTGSSGAGHHANTAYVATDVVEGDTDRPAGLQSVAIRPASIDHQFGGFTSPIS